MTWSHNLATAHLLGHEDDVGKRAGDGGGGGAGRLHRRVLGRGGRVHRSILKIQLRNLLRIFNPLSIFDH